MVDASTTTRRSTMDTQRNDRTSPLFRITSGGVGATVWVRPSRPGDLPAVEAMVRRSSADTLHRRFHGPFGTIARRELRRMVRSTPAHRSWVAVATGGVRGVVSLVLDHEGQAEVALLVEDEWQRHGVGRQLAEEAMVEACSLRLREVVAFIQAENWQARAFFASVAPEATACFEGGDVIVRIPVPARVRRAPGPRAASPAYGAILGRDPHRLTAPSDRSTARTG
jgi:N-acetylglutamate synthase-like GNAT family acetyltransferase